MFIKILLSAFTIILMFLCCSDSKGFTIRKIGDWINTENIWVTDSASTTLVTIDIPELEGCNIEELDFKLDKALGEIFNFHTIEPARYRYGLYEFNAFETAFKDYAGTIYGIMCKQSPDSYPIHYIFWSKTDTVAHCRRKNTETSEYPKYGEFEVECGSLYNSPALRFLEEGRIEELPQQYRAPVDSGLYESVALRLEVVDNHIISAHAIKFYNAIVLKIIKRRR